MTAPGFIYHCTKCACKCFTWKQRDWRPGESRAGVRTVFGRPVDFEAGCNCGHQPDEHEPNDPNDPMVLRDRARYGKPPGRAS